MNGRSLAAVLWRRRGTAGLTVLLVAVLTTLWLLFAPRTYTATATITVAPQPALASSHATVVDYRATLARLANSVPVIAEVRQQVGPKRTVPTLLDEVSGHAVSGTALIRITVQDSDRHYAARVANADAAILPRVDPSGGQLRFASAGVATGTTSFTSPDITDSVLIGVGAAIVLALIAAFVREAAAGTVDDPRQVPALADVPVLATVSRPSEIPDVIGADAHRFRTLRVSMEFASSDEPTHTVVIAPVVPDDAAGWTVVNLAAALAQVQHRVLVIDADFGDRWRHPALRSKGPGLIDVLRGDAELRDAVRPSTVSGVNVLSAGRTAPGALLPANLVELEFHKVLAQIDNEVDLVLVNAAPLTESDDARIMAAGAALVVLVPARRVRASALREVARALREMRLRVLGVVLLRRTRH